MSRGQKDRGIYPVSPGVWRVQVPAGIDVAKTAQRDDGKVVYRSVERRFRGTITDARKYRATLIVEAQQGRYGGTEATISDLTDAWLRELERIGRAPNTISGYRGVLDRYVLPVLGKTKARDLTPRVVADLLGNLAESGLSAPTVKHVHAALSSMYAQAVRWEWVPANPMSKVRAPSLANKRPKIPTVAEVAHLLQTAATTRRPEMERVIWIAATTGIRQGELNALRVTDIDFDRQTINVERAMSDGKVWATKNRRWREVALDDLTVLVIRKQIAVLAQRAAGGGSTLAADAYLFTDHLRGIEPWHHDLISSGFRRIKKKAGLPHVTFHQLRKFMESMALDAGFSVAEVAHQAGHDPAVLLRYYAGGVDEKGRALPTAVANLLPAPGR